MKPFNLSELAYILRDYYRHSNPVDLIKAKNRVAKRKIITYKEPETDFILSSFKVGFLTYEFKIKTRHPVSKSFIKFFDYVLMQAYGQYNGKNKQQFHPEPIRIELSELTEQGIITDPTHYNNYFKAWNEVLKSVLIKAQGQEFTILFLIDEIKAVNYNKALQVTFNPDFNYWHLCTFYAPLPNTNIFKLDYQKYLIATYLLKRVFNQDKSRKLEKATINQDTKEVTSTEKAYFTVSINTLTQYGLLSDRALKRECKTDLFKELADITTTLNGVLSDLLDITPVKKELTFKDYFTQDIQVNIKPYLLQALKSTLRKNKTGTKKTAKNKA